MPFIPLTQIAADFDTIVSDLEAKDRPWIEWAICAWQNRPDFDVQGILKMKLEAVEANEGYADAIREVIAGGDGSPEMRMKFIALIGRYDQYRLKNEGYEAFRGAASFIKKVANREVPTPAADQLQAQVLARLVTLSKQEWGPLRAELRRQGYLTVQ